MALPGSLHTQLTLAEALTRIVPAFAVFIGFTFRFEVLGSEEKPATDIAVSKVTGTASISQTPARVPLVTISGEGAGWLLCLRGEGLNGAPSLGLIF